MKRRYVINIYPPGLPGVLFPYRFLIGKKMKIENPIIGGVFQAPDRKSSRVNIVSRCETIRPYFKDLS
jgi:hypothetical protein